ncbi:MAG: glycosyltransferase [candidate division KSB1 bacterium]|nr:glycosyltransferase [candidate division KSB1 bacterium]
MAKTAKIKISVIIAVQNQQEFLPSLTADLLQTLSAVESFEIIFVDDGSTDNSWQVLQQIAEQHRNVRAIKLRTAFGESSALEAAMETAAGEEIIYLTSRVRARAQDLVKFIDRLKEGTDVVVGRRLPRRDSIINRLVSRLFNWVTNRLTGINLHDINSGVLAVRREVLECVPFYGALNTFLPVLAFRQGYRITEETIEQLPGRFAVSLRPKDYVRRFLDLISVLFLSKYSKKPLHFLGFPGMILTTVGAVIDIYLFFYRLFGFGGIAGRPMLLLGTVLLVIGLQMIAIGLLGEMIIFTHARQIREYNIEEIIN